MIWAINIPESDHDTCIERMAILDIEWAIIGDETKNKMTVTEIIFDNDLITDDDKIIVKLTFGVINDWYEED